MTAEPVVTTESEATVAAEPAKQPGRLRKIAAQTLTVSAFMLVFAALIMPNILSRFERPGTYVRLPIEGFVAIGLVLLLPGRWKRIAAGVLGGGLALLTIEKIIDMGFHATLSRPFDPVLDWVLFDDAQSFLADSAGRAGAIGAVVGVIVLVLAILALMSLAAIRITKVADRHRRASFGTALTGTAVWVVLLVLGVQVFGTIPVAARSSAMYVWDRAKMIKGGLRDEKAFEKLAATDAFSGVPGDQLLTGLRGKDVMVFFVESYGRSAIEDPALNPGTVDVLAEGNATLKQAGYVSRSGWLGSPTAGGGSWLAHSTLLSGLWIDKQNRYRNLTSSNRLTLTSAFAKAGFDTMSVMPGATRAWPEGNFYGYDKVYDSRNTGYQGPAFSWAPQPDQYTLSWFEKNVHGPAHDPMFVEMPLVSSHTPWAPLPQFIDWDDVGDGSIYKQIQEEGKKVGSIWKDPVKLRREYSRSIQYTLTTVISWLERYGDENTVMILLGDHQPSSLIVGDGASRDVPITLLAKDKNVMAKASDWGWTAGIAPAPQAPVWPMDQFRDRFMTTFGPPADVSRVLAPPKR
ncbi:sulfatase-like hydrolase/transferase [Actinoplanes sp. NPDC049599]|uniref:sulfatase-like hydrolase/transferase n=1 Tax=Actinoplanes sp. NPDC049599 TaxID=3363903 RepID=UPI003797041D